MRRTKCTLAIIMALMLLLGAVTHAAVYEDFEDEEGLPTFSGTFPDVSPDAGTKNIVEYRSRSITGNWYFWRWGAWSDWKTGTPPSAANGMQVEVQYRYKVE